MSGSLSISRVWAMEGRRGNLEVQGTGKAGLAFLNNIV